MMNQGQFTAITALLTEIRDLLKEQQLSSRVTYYPYNNESATVSGDSVVTVSGATWIKPQPAKRRGRQKKVSE